MLTRSTLLGAAAVAALASPAVATAWSPDHIVVVIEENRDYTDFIGNTASAPYINGTLVPEAAILTNSLAIGHPSEPNYLQLFSGSPQGTQGTDGPVPGSLAPAGAKFTGSGLDKPNLGAAMFAAGKSFAGYSEDLHLASDPLAYQAGGLSGALYARKHNPWSNFVAVSPTGNQLSASTNLDFSAFASTPFASLPTLAFIDPNQCNDAHGLSKDCPNGGAGFQKNITLADTWLKNNLDAYAQWARTHNSLLIITTDEGNTTVGTDPATGLPLSRVATLLIGEDIRPGFYSDPVTEYGICNSIATMEGAAAPGACAGASLITDAAFIPEPASAALFAGGLLGLGLIRRRKIT